MRCRGITGRARDEEGRMRVAVERQRDHQHGAEQRGEGEDGTEREADPAVNSEPETSQRGAQHE